MSGVLGNRGILATEDRPVRLETGSRMTGQTLIEHRVVDEQPCAPAPWKRAFDWAVILLLSPIIALVWLAVALIVRCGSRGPILFRQKRVGHRGHEFVCYKFRTMKVDADTGKHRDHTRRLINTQEPMVKLDADSDPRLAPFGTILRATGLD